MQRRKKRKWDIELVREYLSNLGYKLVSNKYINAHIHLIIKDKNNYLYYITFDKILQNKKPNMTHKSNPYSIHNIKLWCQLNNKSFILLDSQQYIHSKSILKWKCLKDNCGEIFNSSWICISNNSGCPFCVGKQVGLSNCLATKNPKLASEWHPTKNGDLTPYDVTCGSIKKIWWTCEKGHEWETGINSRQNGSGCPYCAGQKPTIENNLLLINPELCKEWDYSKNDKPPEEYCPNSNNIVWWICINNHSWKASINNRNKGRKCRICSGRVASSKHNLLKMFPDICKDWDYDKNEKIPSEYTPNSSEKVYWKCHECNYEWESIISNRTNGRGCRNCNKSKGEKCIQLWLENRNIPFMSQYQFVDLLSDLGNPLRFDFAVFEDLEKTKIKYLIEYDGIFHYEKQYESDGFEIIQYHDKLKNEYCIKHNIKLIRIPYWEFDNVENILEKM